MIYKKLKIPDVILIEPSLISDHRGYFFEAYNEKNFNDIIKRDVHFIQDNHSKSTKGVLRGLHYQRDPYEQAKLVRVVSGEIWDIALDLRKESDTYGQWVGEKLSAENKKQLWIPEGFAHGFYVLSDVAEVVYKVNQYYSKEHECTIHWKQNNFNITWPIKDNLIIISKKDDEC